MDETFAYSIFESAAVVFETFIVYQYIDSFFECKSGKKDFIILFSLFCLGLLGLSLFYPKPVILIVYISIGIYLLEAILYKSLLSSRIFSILFFTLMIMGSEALCAWAIHSFYGVNATVTSDYGMFRVLFISISKLSQILFVKFLGTIVSIRKDKNSQINMRQTVPLLVCQVMSIILTHHVIMIGINVYGYFNFAISLSTISILYINGIIFWYFDWIKSALEYKSRNYAAETKYELQKQYYEMLEEYQKETDALWHDMNKHMDLIRNLVTSGLHDNSAKYLEELETHMLEMPEIIKTPQPVLSALLTNELRKAKKLEIDFICDIRLLSEIEVSPVDLCILIGNTIDNAIEACMGIPLEANRYVKLSIYQKESTLLIEVENTYDSNYKKVDNLGRHGYGLKNVRKVVSKYSGYFKNEFLDNIYRVKIILP